VERDAIEIDIREHSYLTGRERDKQRREIRGKKKAEGRYQHRREIRKTGRTN
jgi:hypothetical protein